MSCVFKNSKTVTRENGYWLVNGKYKVKDISKCEFAVGTTIIVQTQDEQYEMPIVDYINEERSKATSAEVQEQAQPKKVDAPKVTSSPRIEDVTTQPTPPVTASIVAPPSATATPLVTETLKLETQPDEINQLLKLAGDNAWLVAAALLFSLIKRYLDMKQQNDANLKNEIEVKDKKLREDLGGECKTRHADAGKSYSELNTSITRLERDVKFDGDSFRQDLNALKKDVDDIKKKMYEQELAAKYLRQLSEDEEDDAPRRGRPRKNTSQQG